MIITKRLLRTFAVLLLVAAAAAAQTFNPQDVIPLDKAIHTATLTNGLNYFVRQNSRPAKRVSLRLAVKAGSVNETDDQQGLAHLIEHMAFNGSEHFEPGELVSFFESTGSRLGPHVNAYTSFDETVYMLDLPTDKPEIVSKGLTALADFAGGLTLSTEEINKERGVVIEEWRGGLGAGSRIRDKQFPILFYKSRYAERLPIGKPEILRNAPPERLRSFYDTWYRPDRMAVVAVGDLDAGDLEKNITATFGGLNARGPVAPQPDRTVPIHQETLTSVVTDPEVTSSSVQIVRKRPRESESRVGDYRRQLIERFVDHMFDERFSDVARKPDSKILGAGASNSSLSRGVSAFTIAAGVQDGKLEDGVSTLAKSLLADNSRVVLAVSPQKPNIRIPSDAELQAAITVGNAAPVTEWIDTTSTRGVMERLPATGAVGSRRTIDSLGVTIVKFGNGVEAWLKPTDFKNDQVLFSLNASGGTSLAPPADFPEASMAAGYVGIAGVGGLKALDMQKVLAGKLASARPFMSLSSHGISGSAAPAQLETALQLLYQTFTAPGDDSDAFALLKRQLDAMLANRGRAPGQVFAEKLAQVNSSNHYTSQPLTTERLATLDREKMMTFYRQRFSNAADFTFFMVGAFKVDEVVPLLAQYVGSLPSAGSKSSAFRDVGLKFPQTTERAKVEAGRGPRGPTLIRFFAGPTADPTG